MIENFSSEFLAFCRSKPEDEQYDPGAYTNCALAQFINTTEYFPGASRYFNVPAIEANWDINTVDTYPQIAYRAAVWGKLEYDQPTGPSTFGALVQRLEAAGVK